MRRQPGPAEGEQVAQRLVGHVGVQRPAIHQRAAVARQGQRDAGQRGDGAAGADQPHAAGADLLADAMHRSKPARRAATSSTTAWKPASVKQDAPQRSARVTTPSGMEM